jgi:mannose-6-phosphate isomerase
MVMHLYPVLFEPIHKKMIWGGESWDVSCRPDEMSVIENGPYAGTFFDDYLNTDRKKTMGTRLAPLTRFPLLVKIITANDALSVQVHPCDDYAGQKGGGDSGKNEMWYIIKPPTDGKLIIGLRGGVTFPLLMESIRSGNAADCLHYLSVKAGDMVNIPAGLVHALTRGAVVAEVQQNSDITYRLYDYGRIGPDGEPRPLHIEDALAVADFEGRIPKEIVQSIRCAHFAVNKLVLDNTLEASSDTEAFTILVCVEGAVTISCKGGETVIEANRSAFIPAGLGGYAVRPAKRAVVLVCGIPPSEKQN